MTGAWTPQPASDQTLEDVTLREWIGQALGHASVCWTERPTGVFDSTAAKAIADSLHAHVQRVIDEVMQATRKEFSEDLLHGCSWCSMTFGKDEAKAKAHVQTEHAGEGLCQLTTRQLLNELRRRAEAWAGEPGSGHLDDGVDALQDLIKDRDILDGRREP